MEGWQLAEHARQINEATAAFIEVQAMVAENNQRKVSGEAMAYDSKAFYDVMESYDLGYNQRVEKQRSFQI